VENRISVVEQQNLDFNDIEDGSEAVECRKDDHNRSHGGEQAEHLCVPCSVPRTRDQEGIQTR
jgi:hypothetical protein